MQDKIKTSSIASNCRESVKPTPEQYVKHLPKQHNSSDDENGDSNVDMKANIVLKTKSNSCGKNTIQSDCKELNLKMEGFEHSPEGAFLEKKIPTKENTLCSNIEDELNQISINNQNYEEKQPNQESKTNQTEAKILNTQTSSKKLNSIQQKGK